MFEKFFLHFFNRAIGFFGKIYSNPRKLAALCLLILVSFVLSLREYRKDREEGPIWGKVFSNTLWLSLGLGLPTAGILGGAGIAVRALGMRHLGLSLRALARYVLFPFRLHLVEDHHAKSDGTTTFWTVAIGFWAAAIEAVIGVVYCLSLIGIPFGIKQLKLAPSIWAPNRFRVLTDVEFDELMDAKHTMSRRSARDW